MLPQRRRNAEDGVMNYEAQLEVLLEEILESHRSIEDVCAEHPALANDLRRRFHELRNVEAQIDLLFPSPASPGSMPHVASAVLNADLPTIPGYEVQTILGHGGMGVVYRARQVNLNRDVAIKMLLAGPYASQVERLRFAREAEAIARLQHPQIVQIYDVGEVSGRPFYAMELVEGGTLAKQLADKPVSVRDAAETLALLSRAVQSAHECGIVHRDLKPANILLDENATPKISDFGLARQVDFDAGLTLTGARMGTPSYMAPEQVIGGEIGPAVDIYALGTLLYQMLTGRPPFRGESVIETEQRLISETPQSPSELNSSVPRDLETICLKCLEKEPYQRYATAAELADDLQRFLRYEPIAARPIGRAVRLGRWVRRSPTTAALIVTALALLGMSAIYGTRELALAANRQTEKARLTARLESGLKLEREGRYSETRALLGKLGDGGHQDLRQRIDRAVANLDSVEELVALRLHRVSVNDGRHDAQSNRAHADARYEILFDRLEIGNPDQPPDDVAARIKTSDFRDALVAALDDWAVCAAAPTRRCWLLEVARLADHDPTGLRDRIRSPDTWLDKPALLELSQAALDAGVSIQLLRAIGDRMAEAGMEPIAFRKQIQRMHTDDFLANFTLADELRDQDPADAVRYYQAALAIRPQAALAHNNMGLALEQLGRKEEAQAYFESALQIDPTFVMAIYNVGRCDADAGNFAEAIAQFQAALRIDPNLAVAHYQLGLANAARGDHPEAIGAFRSAIELDPQHAAAYGAMGESLFKIKRVEEAECALRQCLERMPLNDPQRPRFGRLLEQCRQR